jgi:hypothetical protein
MMVIENFGYVVRMLKYEVYRARYKLTYCRHGKYHRKDSPAILWYGGDLMWFKYGKNIGYVERNHVEI